VTSLTGKATKSVAYAITALFAFFALFPFVWLVITSLKPAMEAFSIPPLWLFVPTLENYQTIMSSEWFGGFVSSFANSVIIASISTVLSIGVGILAAYSFARFKTGGSGLPYFILSTRMFPQVAVIIPVYLLFYYLKLVDTHIAVGLSHTLFNLPFSVWMLVGFLGSIPIEIEEAAMIDGCSRLGAFRRTVLPLAVPGIVVTAIFCFSFSWNEFLYALVLTGANTRTLPVMAISFVEPRGIVFGPLSATGVLTTLPSLVFAYLLRRHLVKGLTLGAVKQ